MIDKALFRQIKFLMKEYDDLEKRLDKEENKTVSDIVTGSSGEYPYTSHGCKIEGIQSGTSLKKYRKMIKNKKRDLGKKIASFEYELNHIEDSEIRQILRCKYIDGLKNYQVAHEMNRRYKTDEYTADGVRMRINRFFEKN